jgi:hypothetical protein
MPGAELNWPQLTELFRLCDKLQAPEAETSLMVAIRMRIQQRPLPTDVNIWGVFRLPGERDDVQLGKAAIRALETVKGSWESLYRYNKVETDLALTPFPFAASLLTGGFLIKTQFHRPGGFCTTIDQRSWDKIADDFIRLEPR